MAARVRQPLGGLGGAWAAVQDHKRDFSSLRLVAWGGESDVLVRVGAVVRAADGCHVGQFGGVCLHVLSLRQAGPRLAKVDCLQGLRAGLAAAPRALHAHQHRARDKEQAGGTRGGYDPGHPVLAIWGCDIPAWRLASGDLHERASEASRGVGGGAEALAGGACRAALRGGLGAGQSIVGVAVLQLIVRQHFHATVYEEEELLLTQAEAGAQRGVVGFQLAGEWRAGQRRVGPGVGDP
mmetsp:Transcript_31598/g.89716  ORF Transcript_31598/g.89716 Transcript_31598/m.89716 type:complete len:238 (-) Transcript_31598:2692-3405(-)